VSDKRQRPLRCAVEPLSVVDQTQEGLLLGSPLARNLVGGDEPVVLAAKDQSRARALADGLGPLARAASVQDAIAGADVVVFAVWLDTIKELIATHARLLENKVVVDPSNRSGSTRTGR